MQEGLKERCATCAAADGCKKAFGRFWHDRSGGGVGCRNPFPARRGRPDGQGSSASAGEAGKRQPWEIAVLTRGRSAGIYCTAKRNGMAGRSGR